mmetsp:Transcript_3587/g.6927  ORF Transcript_3587/g.6927 Transcript_3587/m.6927 type:complete len:101 (+) Transcript_3587:419-721(+)
MNEDSPIPFTPDVGVLARSIIYLFSLYYAFYLFSLREHSPRKTGNHSSSDTNNESDEAGSASSTTTSISSLANPSVRLSCVPVNSPLGRIDAGMAVDTTT